MIEYVGRKRIKGKSMNRLDYNIYRGWDLSDDEDGTDEGMLIEYIDGGKSNHPNHKGYISWSPKEVFDNAYKVAETWKDRLNIEEEELRNNLEKLDKAISNNLIPKDQISILEKQLEAMVNYHTILINRINNVS